MANVPNFGTLSTLDTLASTQQNIATYGEDRAFEAIDRALEAHNRIVSDMMGDFVETTTDRLRRFGNPVQMAMVELDEFGNADAQKVGAGVTVGFPLRLYGIALQWTKKFFQNARTDELAAQFTAAMDADVSNLITQLKKCIYTPTNYTSDDPLVDHLNLIKLPVKALANADGLGLPVGPNGETFNGSTHTHYLACVTPGTLTTTDANALITTVIEHFSTGEPVIYINRGDETAWRNLSGFVPYHDVRIIQPTTAPSSNTRSLDVVDIYNRAIGVYNGAEVWVKFWCIQGYAFAMVKGQPIPFVMRVRDVNMNKLVLQSDDEDHPLRSRQFEREMGFGTWNRVNGAILDMVHGSYTTPTSF